MVDLPQPDSPTRPRVSPRSTLERHADDGLDRRRACAGGPAADRELLDQIGGLQQDGTVGGHLYATDSVAGAARALARRSSRPMACPWIVGDRPGARAPRSSQTPGTRACGQRGWNAQPGGGREHRRRLRPGSGVSSARRRRRRGGAARRAGPRCRGARVVEDVVDGARLDQAPGVHHQHPVGDAGHDAEVVGDQHDRRVEALA